MNGANENSAIYKSNAELINEYENIILELSDKEVEYYNLKETYTNLSEKIIEETDFKTIYGKNNAEVRKNHVKRELTDTVKQLKKLEFSINYLHRRISFLNTVLKIRGSEA